MLAKIGNYIRSKPVVRKHLLINFFLCKKFSLLIYLLKHMHCDMRLPAYHPSNLLDDLAIKLLLIVFKSLNHELQFLCLFLINNCHQQFISINRKPIHLLALTLFHGFRASFSILHLGHIWIIVANANCGVIIVQRHPILETDSLHFIAISIGSDFGFQNIAICRFNHLFWKVLTHFQEGLFCHLVLVFGIVDVSIEDQEGISKKVYIITISKGWNWFRVVLIKEDSQLIENPQNLLWLACEKQVRNNKPHKFFEGNIISMFNKSC